MMEKADSSQGCQTPLEPPCVTPPFVAAQRLQPQVVEYAPIHRGLMQNDAALAGMCKKQRDHEDPRS